jgi:hypothetical protein
MTHNGLRLGVVRVFGEGFVGKTNAYLETPHSILLECPHNAKPLLPAVFFCRMRLSIVY